MFRAVLQTDGSDLRVIVKHSHDGLKWAAVFHVGVADQDVPKLRRDVIWQRSFLRPIDSQIRPEEDSFFKPPLSLDDLASVRVRAIVNDDHLRCKVLNLRKEALQSSLEELEMIPGDYDTATLS